MDKTRKRIQGYLECDSTIVRITSLEDIKDFLVRFGKSTKEMSESELYELTKQKSSDDDLLKDDCNIAYSQNPKILQWGTPIINYKVAEETIAIADNAFSLKNYNKKSMFNLNSILLPTSIIAIGQSAFVNKRNLSRINLPSSLMMIGKMAFYDCTNLKNIVFPETIKYIGVSSFEYTAISSITIPSQVEKIGSYAFANCSQLKTVIFEGIPKTIGSEVLGSDPALEKIIIPLGSIDYFVKALFPLPKELFEEV